MDKIFQNIQINITQQGTIHDFFSAYPHVLENEEYGWMKYEKFAYVKYPVYHFEQVNTEELKRIFKKTNAPLLSYSILNPEGNVYWYVCKSIAIDNLKSEQVRNIKKAASNYIIKHLTHKQLLEFGFEAYSDTRMRVGLSDYTKTDFYNRFSIDKNTNANFYIGAFRDNILDSFASIIIINNDVEIEGLFSRSDSLNLRPNNFLIFSVLHYFLNVQKMDLVSYGFSSIQEGDFEGLHRFKLKCGFEAIPVQRIFVVNPKYKIFINSFNLKLAKSIIQLFPNNRIARKINGVINILSN